jgi:hypothetical protein
MAAKSLFLYIVRTPFHCSEISKSFLKCADGTIRPIIRQGKIAQVKSPRVAIKNRWKKIFLFSGKYWGARESITPYL